MIKISPYLTVDLIKKQVVETDGKTYHLNKYVIDNGILYYCCQFENTNSWVKYKERWLFSSQGWVINRFTLHAKDPPFWCDWFIDIDSIEVREDNWVVYNHFLDVGVHEGVGYEIEDADELADAVKYGTISNIQLVQTLRSLDDLCHLLQKFRFSIRTLLFEFSPILATQTAESGIL